MARRKNPELNERVFVDSAAWIALLDRRDALHSDAVRVFDSLRRTRVHFVTTEFVLLEVANALANPAIRMLTGAFLDNLRQERDVSIIPASSKLFADGWGLFRQRHDKAWGLTDCISFAVMARERITRAFTSDHHFEQAGFVRLLTP